MQKLKFQKEISSDVDMAFEPVSFRKENSNNMEEDKAFDPPIKTSKFTGGDEKSVSDRFIP